MTRIRFPLPSSRAVNSARSKQRLRIRKGPNLRQKNAGKIAVVALRGQGVFFGCIFCKHADETLYFRARKRFGKRISAARELAHGMHGKNICSGKNKAAQPDGLSGFEQGINVGQ
jgi:hypothetical protein